MSARSQSRIVWSSPPDARCRPSGENARTLIGPACPSSSPRSRRPATSQSRIRESEPAAASDRPSGENATAEIISVPASSVARGTPEPTSQRVTVPSKLPAARSLAAGREGKAAAPSLGMFRQPGRDPLAFAAPLPEGDRIVTAARGHPPAVGRDGQGTHVGRKIVCGHGGLGAEAISSLSGQTSGRITNTTTIDSTKGEGRWKRNPLSGECSEMPAHPRRLP